MSAPPPAPATHPDGAAPPRITVLLCTFNGARHLEAQLASYVAQDHGAWDLWVSDDGSTDDTWTLLEAFARTHGSDRRIHLTRGPGRGIAANYLSALCHADFPTGRPVALSDQDDVWLPHKLTRALAGLGHTDGPVLYGAQCQRTDPDLVPLSPSRPPPRPVGFANALVQNVVSGNTATLNPAALDLVRRAGVPEGVPYHDWWLYQLISGAGGRVVIDAALVALYRQHAGNAMGAHRGAGAALRRVGQLLDGTYGGWLRAGWTALEARAPLLTPEAGATVHALRAAPPGPARLSALRRAGLYRQGRLGQAALLVLTGLGRL